MKKSTRSAMKPLVTKRHAACTCGSCKTERGEGHTDSKDDLLPNERPIYDACIGVWSQIAAGGDYVALADDLRAAFQRGFTEATMVEWDEYAADYSGWEETAYGIINDAADAAGERYAQGWIELISASIRTERGEWDDKRLRDIAVTEGSTASMLLVSLTALLNNEARKAR